MLWVKAFHIIFMVTWFGGLFYLPRLFLYHAEARDTISIARFKVMEFKLFYYITTPGALLTLLFGAWTLALQPGYLHMPWLHLKLSLVALLVAYHFSLAKLLRKFRLDKNQRSVTFYRIYNEIPAILLIFIVILVVVKPNLA